MREVADEFRWPVRVAGYRWISAQPQLPMVANAAHAAGLPPHAQLELYGHMPPGWHMAGYTKEPQERCACLAPAAGSAEEKVYQPLKDETGLFLMFARAEPTVAGIARFAAKYGMLGLGAELHVKPLALESDWRSMTGRVRAGELTVEEVEGIIHDTAEPVGCWAYQMYSLRAALDLWDLVQQGDSTGLAHRIQWRRGEGGGLAVYYTGIVPPDSKPAAPRWPGFGESLIASQDENPQLLDSLRPGDLYGPAFAYIEHTINARLDGLVAVRSRWAGRRDRLPQRLVPRSLLGVIWLQFAQACDANRKYQDCAHCGRPFEVSPTAFRASKQFCKDSCRVQAHRKRREAALTLHAEGKAVREIAKEVKTEEDVVRGWIKAQKKRGK
jgi:hypothetical protein